MYMYIKICVYMYTDIDIVYFLMHVHVHVHCFECLHVSLPQEEEVISAKQLCNGIIFTCTVPLHTCTCMSFYVYIL